MKHFHFAPSVLALVNRLLPQIAPESSLYNVEDYVQASAVPHRNSHWKHILALHLRGGDGWDAACKEKGINAE
jgi:hypothetical protein